MVPSAEGSRALDIKIAIESDPELDNLTDFWYVQLAIVDGTDVEAAKDHARCLQYFREEYGVRDTMEDAKRTIWDFVNLFDDWVLSFSYSTEYQSYIWVVDIAKINKNKLTTPESWRTILAGIYYMRHAANPSFYNIRNGISIMYECDGFDLHQFGGMNFAKRLGQEILGIYPAKHCAMKWFHTGVLFMGVGVIWDVTIVHLKSFLDLFSDRHIYQFDGECCQAIPARRYERYF